ncbi:MAG: hypothetical protein WC824_01930 [Bacteroidota bacterium]|jgi:hypothetical protein
MKLSRKHGPITFSPTLRIRTDCSTSFSIKSVLLAIALLQIAGAVQAQQFVPWRSMRWVESFSPAPLTPYILGSDTRIDAAQGFAILTPEEVARTGRLILPSLLSVDYFDVSFRAWFGREVTANGSGADGIVFLFAPISTYPETGGGALNFDGCFGYGIEFDTYQNSDRFDRSPEHVAVIKDRSDNHLLSEVLFPGTLEDERWHVLRIRFRAGIVEVFIDGTSRLSTAITDFFPFEGFFGFSSATGFATNEHRIDDISLSLPSRLRSDFGAVNVCRPVRFDTALVLRNNHPDGGTLQITAVTLQSATPGVFTIPLNPAPTAITQGADLRIPLRIDVSSRGSYSAVLKIEAASGETVFDTLMIRAEEAMLEWTPARIEFPVTWVGDLSEVSAMLRNTGQAPILITGTGWRYSGRGVFTVSLPLPITLVPGDTLPVSIRYAPMQIPTVWDSLFIMTECGEKAPLYVIGSGENERIQFRLQTPMLLSPGETGDLVIVLDSVPRRIVIEEVRFELTFDPAFTALIRIDKISTGLPADAVISPPWMVGTQVGFTLTVPGGLPDTGALIAVKLQAAAPGPECRDVNLSWDVSLPYDLSGSVSGDVCINPSCRLPDGLHRAALPRMAVSPQPGRDLLTVRLTSPSSISASVHLLDARGRRLSVLFDGLLTEDGATRQFSVAELSSGYYYLLLQCPFGESVVPVVIEK